MSITGVSPSTILKGHRPPVGAPTVVSAPEPNNAKAQSPGASSVKISPAGKALSAQQAAYTAADAFKFFRALSDANALTLLGQLKIVDTAANIQSAIDNLGAIASAGKLGAITIEGTSAVLSLDATNFSGALNNPSSTDGNTLAVQKIIGSYTLNLTGISVSDALTAKAPTSKAKLTFGIVDTADNIASSIDRLQDLARQKQITRIETNNTTPIILSSAKLKSATDAINAIRGSYSFAIRSAKANEVALIASNIKVSSISIADTSANILKAKQFIDSAISKSLISEVALTDSSSPTVSVDEAYNLSSFPKFSMKAGIKLTIADTASNVIARARYDLGNIIKDAGQVVITNTLTTRLSIEDAITLRSIKTLKSSTAYFIADTSAAIVAQSSKPGDTIVSGSRGILVSKKYSINEIEKLSRLRVLDSPSKYIIEDTAERIVALSWSDPKYSNSNGVSVKDTGLNILAKLNQLQILAKQGKITTLTASDGNFDISQLTNTQLKSNAEVIGKILNRVMPDTTPPNNPIISNVGGSDSIVSTQTSDNLILGTAEALSSVEFKYQNQSLGTVQTGADGNFTYALTPANLTTIGQGAGKAIAAIATDAAGNASNASTFSFSVDTLKPNAPTISNIGGNDATISSQTNDHLILGAAEALSSVEFKYQNQSLGTVQTGADGNFTYALTTTNLTTIGQGAGKAITVIATDAAGNASNASTFSFSVDTLKPNAPTISNIGGNDATISSQTDDHLILGAAEALSSVELKYQNQSLGTVQTGTDGNFTYALTTTNLTTIGQGAGKAITAIATDAAGNASNASTFSFSVDTLKPNAPMITKIADDDIVDTSDPTDISVEGTAENNSTVSVKLGSSVLGTAKADSQGLFIYSLTAANLTSIGLGQGLTLTAIATDNAGNESDPSVRRSFDVI